MNDLQFYFVIVYILFNCACLFIFFKQFKKKNYFGLSGIFNLIGIFVWGDAVLIAPFWILASIFCLYVKSFELFLVFLSVFWLIRSFGEVIYWINQQFSTVKRDKPKDLWPYKFFENDSVYFIYQLYWQIILILSVIAVVYSFHLWLY